MTAARTRDPKVRAQRYNRFATKSLGARKAHYTKCISLLRGTGYTVLFWKKYAVFEFF